MQKEEEVIIMTDTVRVRHLSLDIGEATPWHFHTHIVDNTYCLQGSVEVQARNPEQQFRLLAGQRCEIPTGRVHRVVNVGQEAAIYLLVQGLGEYDFNRKEHNMDPYVTPERLPASTQRWLEQISPYNIHTMKLNRERSALLVVDMQRFFLDPASPTFTCGGLAILPNLVKLILGFRQAGRPVIFTRHVHHPDLLDAGIMGWWWEGMCLEGSPESEIHPEIQPLPGEKVIFKHRYSAFYNTDLETILRCLKVEDIVMSGIMTNMCCESTTRDAYYRDYRVFFLADGTGSINEEMHLASLLNLSFGFAWITTVDEVLAQACD